MLAYVVIGHPLPALAQVDQQRAQDYFKEAQSLCERDGGRLWGMSICEPMVIGDARTPTFATSQPPPDAPRPRLIGILNGPIKWGDMMWTALSWDLVAGQRLDVRHENNFLHESFHIVQMRLRGATGCGSSGAPSHERCGNREMRACWLFARHWRSARLATHVFRTVLKASAPSTSAKASRPTRASSCPRNPRPTQSQWRSMGCTPRRTARVRAHGRVRVRACIWPPARRRISGWPRRIRASDDVAVLLMTAFGVQPVADAEAAAARYGGAELRAAEEAREQQRQARIADLRRRFVDGPVLLMPGGGSGFSDSHGAVVIPDVGTIWFGDYRQNGPWGTIVANKGMLVTSDGRFRRLPAPVRRDEATLEGDGWTVTAGPGWVFREGTQRGAYELVRQQP